jgi:hypothetical protein
MKERLISTFITMFLAWILISKNVLEALIFGSSISSIYLIGYFIAYALLP